MPDVKQYVSEWVNIEERFLNEITLEDIEFEDAARQRIENAITEMSLGGEAGGKAEQPAIVESELPCHGFWVEDTKDLVLCIWSEIESTALIIPEDGWRVARTGMLH